jgi:hypothetical protein
MDRCLPWRRCSVVIASASRADDPGFESLRSVRIYSHYTYIAVLLSKLNTYALSLFTFEKNKCSPKDFYWIRIQWRFGPGTDVLIFFRRKIQRKKLAFLTQNKDKLCNIGFWEKRQFFAENCRKSPKIVIITSTPDLDLAPMHSWSFCWEIYIHKHKSNGYAEGMY